MSLYSLQKLIRDINRNPACRETYSTEPQRLIENYDLSAEERAALLELNIGKLYAMGVHALLLRPFTLLKQIPEPVYLKAIREYPS